MTEAPDPHAANLLKEAWSELVQGLEHARETLSDPDIHPPVATDRNLAEGHRYLLGQLYRLIETELNQTPEFPYFQRHPWTISKYTIENPDNLYLYAPIDSEGTFRIEGRAYDHSRWRGLKPSAERWAPHYVIFEAHSVAPGDSGTLEELWDGSRVLTGWLDSTEMQVDSDGSFEILLAPSRPEGYAGNFISTLRQEQGKSAVGATKLYVREIFGDWDREHSLDMQITRVGNEGRHPAPRTAAQTATQLRDIGRKLQANIWFWNAFYGFLLDPFERAPQRGPFHLRRNEILQPRQAGLSTGGGQATNFFGGGIFDLGADEALIAEVALGEEPVYVGMHLTDYWGQSLDYANRLTSINQAQAHRDDDGRLRYVIAHRDPGVPNWLDTTEHPSGYITLRTTFPQPPPADRQPTVACRVVPFQQIPQELPADTPRVTEEERRAQIAARQRHVARRYRQY
ncbi:MAG: hypothetical protein PVH21_16630 [Myxococcales bacterium]|jgi:hypothetical protein